MANRFIDKSMLDAELLALINATSKITPVTYSVISGGTNPDNDAMVRVIDGTHKNEIYVWEDNAWSIIGAEDKDINWSEVKNAPTTFPPSTHTHTKADITDFAHNHDSSYAPISHNHDSSYASITHNHDINYAPITHNHDGSYAPITHDHDGRYYTEAEIDAMTGSLPSLTTTNKSNLVLAINEVNAKPSGGGSLTTVTVTGDLNTYNQNGFYHIPASTTNSPVSAHTFEMVVISNGTEVIQHIWSTFSQGVTYFRRSQNNGTTWQAWIQNLTTIQIGTSPAIATNTAVSPSVFYNLGFTDSSFTLPVVSAATDLNANTSSGWKYLTGTLTNQPSGVTTGVLWANFRLNTNGNEYIQQVITNENTPRIFTRQKTGGTWGSWVQAVDTNRVANKITVSGTQPSSPSINDIWIQI